MNKLKTENLNNLLQLIISFTLTYIGFYLIFKFPHSKKILFLLTIVICYIFIKLYLEYVTLKTFFLIGYLLFADLYSYYISNGFFYLSHSFFWIVIALIIGFLICEKNISILVPILPFVIISLFVMISVITKIATFDSITFFSINRNHLPKILFSYGVLIELIRTSKNKGMPLLSPPILFIIVSFLSKSRLSLLVSVLYFCIVFCNFIIKIFSQLRRHKKHYIIAITTLSVITLFFIFIITSFLFNNSRFSSVGFNSSGRLNIYKTFLDQITFKKMLTGFRITDPKPIYDMHNSFITIVMNLGIFSLPILVGYILLEFKLFKNSLFLFLLSLTFVIYSSGERFMFYQIGDFALVPLLFYSYRLPNFINVAGEKNKKVQSYLN